MPSYAPVGAFNNQIMEKLKQFVVNRCKDFKWDQIDTGTYKSVHRTYTEVIEYTYGVADGMGLKRGKDLSQAIHSAVQDVFNRKSKYKF